LSIGADIRRGIAGARAAVERSLDRWHVFVPDGHPEVLAAMEVYARARTGSVFEGAPWLLTPR